MKSDQTDEEAFEAALFRVAQAIAPELELSLNVVEIESVQRALKPRGPDVLDKVELLNSRNKIKAIESALKTLDRARVKLEGVEIPTGRISDAEVSYRLLLGLLRITAGPEKLSTKGGVNWPAREVAKIVAQAFAYHGAKVTFGIKPDGTGPSTAYGRAVELALKELGVKAHWRRPAKFGVKVAKEITADIDFAHREGYHR